MPEKPPKLPSAKELRKAARERFLRARKSQAAYQKQLVSVARQVGSLIKGYAPKGVVAYPSGLEIALKRYAAMLKPWARTITENMHNDVGRRDATSWAELSREMGKTLRLEILKAPVGRMLRTTLAEQVDLITSIPLEAARRVHELTIEALAATGGRAIEIQQEILKSEDVSVGRAKTIARTETSRIAALLLEARANYIGSTHYRWHTSEDADVRPEHRRLNRKIFAWKSPPIAGPGMRYNPGCGPNCRCWAEPILPD